MPSSWKVIHKYVFESLSGQECSHNQDHTGFPLQHGESRGARQQNGEGGGQNLFQVSIIATVSITTFFQQGPKSFQERQKLLTMTFREASLFPFSPVMDLGYGRVTSPCGLWFPHS